MLIGEYQQNIDAKGRMNIPSKFRMDLGESFVVARGLNDCVCIYPKEQWEKFEQTIFSVRSTQKRLQMQRMFCRLAEECTIDSQGRVVIPPTIRTCAKLQKEIVVIGVSDKVEVWDKAEWEKYMAESEMDFDEIVEALDELEI